jgi:NitT/TauT family transport system permease protein
MEPAPRPEEPEPRKPGRDLFELRVDPPFVIGKALGTLCVLLILGLWFLATAGKPEARIIPIAILPSPFEVFGSIGKLWSERDLLDNTVDTLIRVIVGFGLAVVIAIPLGIVAASYRVVNAFLAPIIMFFRNAPVATIIPLTVAWFGLGEKQKVMFIFVATFAFVLSDTVAAVMSIPKRYIETAETVGASKRQIITKVLTPLALPDITTSVRFLFGLGFGYIILAELYDLESGLGALIAKLQRRGNMDEMYLVVLMVVLMAYLIDRGLHVLQRGFFPYREDL